MAIARFLSRHKEGLTWLHIGFVIGSICIAVPIIGWTGGIVFSPWRVFSIFVIATIAWCQNIGLLHHMAHRLPLAPSRLGLHVARFLYSLGGLSYTKATLAHRLHHAHLGTALDPDRLGYESTTTPWTRLRYFLLIGPVRARFAPVDISHALRAMSAEQRAKYDRRCRQDRRLLVTTQLLLVPLSGFYYPLVFAALLFANVLSNVREMAEHGHEGNCAYVDIRVSPLGVLLFSTPGFWFHGVHHMEPSIHYLDLPFAARSVAVKADLPYLQRESALAYLFTGR